MLDHVGARDKSYEGKNKNSRPPAGTHLDHSGVRGRGANADDITMGEVHRLLKEHHVRKTLQGINAGEEYGALTNDQLERAMRFYEYAQRNISNVATDASFLDEFGEMASEIMGNGKSFPLITTYRCLQFRQNYGDMLVIGMATEDDIAKYIGGGSSNPLMQAASREILKQIAKDREVLQLDLASRHCMLGA